MMNHLRLAPLDTSGAHRLDIHCIQPPVAVMHEPPFGSLTQTASSIPSSPSARCARGPYTSTVRNALPNRVMSISQLIEMSPMSNACTSNSISSTETRPHSPSVGSSSVTGSLAPSVPAHAYPTKSSSPDLSHVKGPIRRRRKGKGAESRTTRYSCSYPGCTKMSSEASNLRAHMRLHTGERPYVCLRPACGKSFRWKSSLTYHEKAVHANVRPHVCIACEKRFVEKRKLQLHREWCPAERRRREREACAVQNAEGHSVVGSPPLYTSHPSVEAEVILKYIFHDGNLVLKPLYLPKSPPSCPRYLF